MKLIIFGATGTVGKHLVYQALAQGHEVTAFARTPSAIDFEHTRLSLFAGDVLTPADVENAIAGHDAVLITLGSAKLSGKVRSVGTQNVINAMKKTGVSRLICQSTLGVAESRNNLNFVWKYLMFGVLLRHVLKDHIIQENWVRKSELEWTIVRPSAFVDEKPEGILKEGFSSSFKKLSLKISRGEVAAFMLKQLTDLTYLHKTPGLSY